MTRNTAAHSGDVMIQLESLTKQYPGQRQAAVDDLTLDIPRGEIVILVGPSGCGKTTTMKMINRIIEPSSGRIILDGEDVTSGDPDLLRRRIGYVIQQVGLFPHMTIAQNIATVPRLLGWDKKRISERIDELLETVNMPPGQYRDRYPKQLSGGQLQRVGVARGLSGDPDVMLMDEPFGAIDPITRERLQNEFLRLQAEFHKTIVFVTHDIDEAIKMGDRIAILQEGSKIAQYGTPEEILTAPSNDFVADFVGSGASLKRLKLGHVADLRLEPAMTASVDSTQREAAATLRDSKQARLLVVDRSGRPARWVTADDLDPLSSRGLDGVGTTADSVVELRATLNDALNTLVTASGSVVIAVDGSGVVQGLINIDIINSASRQMRDHAVQGQKPALGSGSRHDAGAMDSVI